MKLLFYNALRWVVSRDPQRESFREIDVAEARFSADMLYLQRWEKIPPLFFMKTLAAGLAALCLFFTTSCGVKSLTMGKASPEMDEAFKSYINAADSAKVNIQSVMVIQHGKIP